MGVVTVNQGTGGGFSRKAEGFYDIRINSVEVRSKEGKPPAVMIKAEILNSDSGRHIGEKISNWMSLADWNFSRWRGLLDNTGIQYQMVPDANGKEGLSFDSDHLVGRCVRVRIQHNQGKDNKIYENWEEYAVSAYNAQQGAQPQQVAPQAPAPQPAPQQGVQPPQAMQPPQANHVPGQGNPPPNQG